MRAWSMKSYPEKRKMMHLWKQSYPENYCFHCRGLFHLLKLNNKKKFQEKKLNVMERERDLSVLVSADGTWHEQINSTALKANRFLELIKGKFSSWSGEISQIIYPKFVRPHLEFASSVWNPHLKYDSKTLESVQCRATVMKESYHMSYQRLDLTDSKTRRERKLCLENALSSQ